MIAVFTLVSSQVAFSFEVFIHILSHQLPCTLIWALQFHIATAFVRIQMSLLVTQFSLPLTALFAEGTVNLQLIYLSLEGLVL